MHINKCNLNNKFSHNIPNNLKINNNILNNKFNRNIPNNNTNNFNVVLLNVK